MNSAALQQIIDDFEVLEDWEDRYVYLIDKAKKLPPFPENLKSPVHIVPGCMSQVWMVPHVQDGKFHMLADSDAILVKGLIAVLFAAYENQPIEILHSLNIEEVFNRLGLERNLSPNRRNGFFAMVERLKKYGSNH